MLMNFLRCPLWFLQYKVCWVNQQTGEKSRAAAPSQGQYPSKMPFPGGRKNKSGQFLAIEVSHCLTKAHTYSGRLLTVLTVHHFTS